MRRFHGWLIAALPAPLGRVLLLHALHEVVELEGAEPLSLQPGRDGDPPVVPHADFCLQAGLPQWTFALADGVRLERWSSCRTARTPSTSATAPCAIA